MQRAKLCPGRNTNRQEVVVLRYGHRDVRDFRVTSHCCLVARAFGADKIIIEGRADEIKKSVEGVTQRWGGNFEVGFTNAWKETLREYKNKGFKTAHLTMYGLPLGKIIRKLRKENKLLVIIGSQKVERAVYEQSDYNVSIGLTPHSEIAALAVFLHELSGGAELEKEFKNAKLRITPQARGKRIERFG